MANIIVTKEPSVFAWVVFLVAAVFVTFGIAMGGNMLSPSLDFYAWPVSVALLFISAFAINWRIITLAIAVVSIILLVTTLSSTTHFISPVADILLFGILTLVCGYLTIRSWLANGSSSRPQIRIINHHGNDA